ncbi:protein FANTASTIC FOUR 3-like [Cucumis melo var. makuwa]|uniref:Protein FANTASTIC FOUR 3-like n=1 Tax=Cucumis melo var. makuwa TaxID=1194695 RepID=A0A5A7VCI6_CUCMM|nr:protein FANTASTIC FOUR 3-like [Cucumis melo var. makuwa]TYK18495.1 protein FANTASTIC FOUR 3-like [Cucumis melo var. makuwa]
MSSSIYQGLQSCLMEPRVLRLKLSPSQSYSSPSPAEEQDSDHSLTHSDPQIQTHLKMDQNHTAHASAEDSPSENRVAVIGHGNGVGGWSFLQAPSGVDGHPPAKRYAPTMALSPKSLEMCTESLGSETGSDGGSEIGSDEKMSLFSPDETETSPSLASGRKSVKLSRLAKKLAKPSYPPPLTSMSGSMGVKVKPYREGGRLVLKAVSIPSTKPCFEVERGGGRLKLRLYYGYSLSPQNVVL